jgi:hypothetical protein
MTAFIVTFLAVFITDIINAYYIKAIQDDSAILASTWATVVTFTASIAVINYTNDHTLLIAALLGAFCGTFIAIKFKKKD